jgi:hypothetical protein
MDYLNFCIRPLFPFTKVKRTGPLSVKFNCSFKPVNRFNRVVLRLPDEKDRVRNPISYPLTTEKAELCSLRPAAEYFKANKPVGRVFEHSVHIIMELRAALPGRIREECLRIQVPIDRT